MQGQGSTVESLSETFEFDHGSTTGNSDMDQQDFWNSFLLDPVETQDLPDYLLSQSDTNMSYVNVTSQESPSLTIWNSAGPSSSEHPLNQGSRDETKMENRRASSLTSNGGGGQRIEGRLFEANNMLSLENVDINLNNNQMDNSQPVIQNFSSNDFPQNSDHNVGHVGTSNQVLEAGLYPHPSNSELLESEYVSSSGGSSNACGNSSMGVRILSEDEGGPGGSDGRRISGKRKNIEIAPEHSSASGNSSRFLQSENSSSHSVSEHPNPNTHLNISRSSDFLSGVSSGQLNPRMGTITGLVASDSLPSDSVTGNSESSQRNFRMRINPAHQRATAPPNLWAPGNTARPSNIWPVNQPSSLPAPFNQSLESRLVLAGTSSQGQFHVPLIPGLPRRVQSWSRASSRASNSRIGSSSSSPIIVGERLSASREETNSRSMPGNSISEPSVFVPTTDSRQSMQVPSNWALANGSASMPGSVAPASRAGSSSGVNQSLGPTWVPHQNPPTQYLRSLSEAVRRTLFSTVSSASGGEGVNLTPQRSVQPATSQGIGRQSGVVLHGQQQPYTRSAIMIDRQREGVPVSIRSSAAAREGRSRMISELRNVLDLVRRRENFRLEDVFIFDHSVVFGGADLLDRHRDMRLDVDNMSYEELLALEEQIGNVSTGLSEEAVLKCLKQRKYISVTVEASAEVEPCSICQEEYIDGEELGTLDCGHDFHAGCVKQWLMHKNLCPICKTSALSNT